MKDRFFVLPYTLHGKHIPNLMGRVVVDPLDPLKRYIPDSSKLNPQDIIPDILEESIAYRSCVEVVEAASSNLLKARLTSYFGLTDDHSANSSVALRSELVQRYQMTQIAPKFKKLMVNTDFAQEIVELLRESKRNEVFMIVGFLTTKGSQWDIEAGGSRRRAGNATVPIGEVSGTSSTFDVTIEGSHTSSAHRRTNVLADDNLEEVFGIAYNVVKKQYSFNRKAQNFVSSRPVLGDEKRSKGGHLTMALRDALGDSDEEIGDGSYDDDSDDSTIIMDPESLAEDLWADSGYLAFEA